MSTVVVTGVAGSLEFSGRRPAAGRPADVDRVVGLDLIPVPTSSDPRLDTTVVDLSAGPGPGDHDLERTGLSRRIRRSASTWRGGCRMARGPGPTTRWRPRLHNQRTLRRVLERHRQGRGAVAVVHVSSWRTVYGAWADNKIPMSEDARLRPSPEFPFAVAKAESERVLSEWADGHPSTAVAVLRPAVTVGTDGRPLYQALGITRAPRLGDEGRPVQYPCTSRTWPPPSSWPGRSISTASTTWHPTRCRHTEEHRPHAGRRSGPLVAARPAGRRPGRGGLALLAPGCSGRGAGLRHPPVGGRPRPVEGGRLGTGVHQRGGVGQHRRAGALGRPAAGPAPEPQPGADPVGSNAGRHRRGAGHPPPSSGAGGANHFPAGRPAGPASSTGRGPHPRRGRVQLSDGSSPTRIWAVTVRPLWT